LTSDLTTHAERYLSALLERSSHHARRVIDEALDSGVSIADVYLRVLQPALYELGERWAAGEINVAYEHYATAVTERLIVQLAERMEVAPMGGRLAVVACTPGEQHALGARMVSDFLRAEGWEVAELGPSTPAGALAELVDAERPDVVALSTATAAHLGDARDVIARLDALDPRPFIAVGGQAWERGRAPDGADLLVADLEVLVDELRRRFPPQDG
jgi:MerR family transcriptional regulator, light-induced transcriptional regulator